MLSGMSGVKQWHRSRKGSEPKRPSCLAWGWGEREREKLRCWFGSWITAVVSWDLDLKIYSDLIQWLLPNLEYPATNLLKFISPFSFSLAHVYRKFLHLVLSEIMLLAFGLWCSVCHLSNSRAIYLRFLNGPCSPEKVHTLNRLYCAVRLNQSCSVLNLHLTDRCSFFNTVGLMLLNASSSTFCKTHGETAF